MSEEVVNYYGRDVMPETARTLPARYYVDPVFLKRELDGLFGRMWFYVGRSEEAGKPGQYFVREINGHNIVVSRGHAGVVRAFHNVCRHRGTPDRRAAHGRSAALPEGRLSAARGARRRVGRARLPQSRRVARSARRAARAARREVPELAHGGPAAGPSDRLRREGELEADHPELQRVPALPQSASGAQQAVALPVRRERAAAPDLHGRAHGPAPGNRDALDGWDVPAPDLSGTLGEGRAERLLLLHLPQHDAQPAPRLHADAHAVADGARPHDQRLRVALPAVGAGAPGLRRVRLHRVLGHDEPAGLARLRALAGRHIVSCLRARPVLEPRGPALRVRSLHRGVPRAALRRQPRSTETGRRLAFQHQDHEDHQDHKATVLVFVVIVAFVAFVAERQAVARRSNSAANASTTSHGNGTAHGSHAGMTAPPGSVRRA